jgi:hypothetical protein
MARWRVAMSKRGAVIPEVGDDYPAILRKMKANARLARRRATGRSEHFYLVTNSVSAAGATPEQIAAIFKASDFEMVVLR